MISKIRRTIINTIMIDVAPCPYSETKNKNVIICRIKHKNGGKNT